MIDRRIRRLIGIPSRLLRSLLFYRYKFDKWHVSTLYDLRYPDQIIRFLNSRPSAGRTSVVEIGCGLGDILRGLKYKEKTGFDIDRNVLKAAAFLSSLKFQKTTFDYFQFPDSKLTGVFDAIIMVNWIHHIPPPLLKSKIEEYFNRNLSHGGDIIIDTVQDPAYEVNHSIDFIVSGLNCEVKSIGKDIRQREVFAIRKK